MTHSPFPMRRITSGPKRHWFGYYDKLQFDPSGRRALGMAVDFEHRSPAAGDTIELGLIDLADGDRWTEVGTTRAWCWQQGCMLQWRPGSSSEILWNDREDGRFVCRVHNLESGKTRSLPRAVYALSPDGRTGIGTDFGRLDHMRPGYGYAGVPDPNRQVPAPENSGIYTLDLDTGASSQIVSVAQVAAIPWRRGRFGRARHYFNHLLFSPGGTRFIFLHRWRLEDSGITTRMFTADPDGGGLHLVDDYGGASHFIWRDSRTILAWSFHPRHGSRFHLYRDRCGGDPEVIGDGVMGGNGHCSYLPGSRWILNDTYPGKDDRRQALYLYHPESGRRVDLGSFPAPEQYAGEWRCDLHPRSSPDGRSITFDSAHWGSGRQIYWMNIAEAVG